MESIHQFIYILKYRYFVLFWCLKWITLVSEMLPSERESAKLEHLSSLHLNNNQLTGKEPFYVPKFILELPRYVCIYADYSYCFSLLPSVTICFLIYLLIFNTHTYSSIISLTISNESSGARGSRGSCLHPDPLPPPPTPSCEK